MNAEELVKALENGPGTILISWMLGHTGWCPMSPRDLVGFARDPYAEMGRQCGVSKEIVLGYKRHYDEMGRCTGTTRKNRRCKIRLHINDLPSFRPGVSDRCEHHQDIP
jgi:hypothetical protein